LCLIVQNLALLDQKRYDLSASDTASTI
jgi:hypothetical protein